MHDIFVTSNLHPIQGSELQKFPLLLCHLLARWLRLDFAVLLVEVDWHAYMGRVVYQDLFDLHAALCKRHKVFALWSELGLRLRFWIELTAAVESLALYPSPSFLWICQDFLLVHVDHLLLGVESNRRLLVVA